MHGKIKKISTKAGLPPGSLVFQGSGSSEKLIIDRFLFDESEILEFESIKYNDVIKNVPHNYCQWLNFNSVNDIEVVKNTGEHFGLHLLTVEDILNETQRPKFEIIDDYIFMSLKMIHFQDDEIVNEHISIVLKENTVITFQQRKGDVFETIRKRLRTNSGIIRKMQSDYLTYSILDSIVDYYYVVLEEIDFRIEELEEKILTNFNSDLLEDLHEIKRTIINFRKNVWPVREIISAFSKSIDQTRSEVLSHYLRDLYDHSIQVMDGIDTGKDMANALMNLYLSFSGNKMNEVMKILTVISTIFIPLTFLAGLYGMNFKYMPELQMRYSYPVLLAIMLTIIIVMLGFFKKNKWF
ncbi:MAG: magnesium/cobalt transporter CorA [Spirochaetes bacterium]|nr:magnesium/cobalt transporter CorA [Spirochaetota bacterium]